MLRKLKYLLLLCILVFSCSITSYAFKQDDNSQPDGEVEESGNGDDGGEGEEPGGSSVPREPVELSFSPNVTALHSVNALIEKLDGVPVYFIPRLEEFPVDLVDTCADLTTEDGMRHQFSVVYDGYFNTEVEYVSAMNDNTDTSDVGRLQTSKKIYSQYDNSRALNLLGYDLLLANEQSTIISGGGSIDINYFPTLVGTAPLTAKTVMMDLYKAVGQYEWDIKITHGIDNTLAVNTSPIMQQLAVDINDFWPGGICTEEGATYVWATRTNPDLYWERVRRDAVFDGGAHKYTKPVYIGNEVSVTFSKNETAYVTMGEFCQLARAIMTLYGEPVLTEKEVNAMIQAYSLTLPKSGASDEAIEAVKYLAAKGICDPADLDLSKNVTFADIEEFLLRIADVDSRLTLKEFQNLDNVMTRAGYVQTDLVLNESSFDYIEEIENPYDTNYYDYYIEAVDGETNFYLDKLAGIDLSEQENMVGEPDVIPDGYTGVLTLEGEEEDVKLSAFACDKLVISGGGVPETTTGSGYFEYMGLKEYADAFYYHFRISRDLSSITVSYDVDPEREKLLDISSYTLMNANGGVYNYSEGKVPHMTFDEACFSDMFLDKERVDSDPNNLEQTESYLADWTWVKISYSESTWDKMLNTAVAGEAQIYKNIETKEVVTARDMEQAYQAGGCLTLDQSNQRFYIHKFRHSSPNSITYISVVAQTPMSYTDFSMGLLNTTGNDVKSTKCYYRHDDNTLLVSCDYLRDIGRLRNITELRNGVGYQLTTSSGNVSLRSDINAVIVGDTYIPVSGETLYYKDGATDLYVNVKAIMGWTDSHIVVSSDGALLPSFDKTKSKVTQDATTVKSLKTFFPASSVNVGYKEFQATKSSALYEGMFLGSSNPLGSYMLVYSPKANDDYIFVWHRQDVKSPNGTVHHLNEDGSRSLFKSLTGISVDNVPDCYVLLSYKLSRTGTTDGFTYCYYNWCDYYTSGQNVVGYVYEPHSYSSIDEAFNAYCSGSSSCILPIVKVGSAFYNLNMNTCTDMEGNSMLPIGSLPQKMNSTDSKVADYMGILTTTTSGGVMVDTSTASYETLDNVIIYPSPVGIFQEVKGLGKKSITDITAASGRLYYGSSLCTIVNDLITINGCTIEPDTNSEAVCAFQGTNSGSVWVVPGDETSIGNAIEELAEKVEVIVSEPEVLVDWAQYSFNRLVQNMDDWSSIFLIFILNILPRVAMLLFFALMLLSLIKDVKPWRMFCQRVFDIYSFLTFGKLNVDTVDTKRVVIISLVCLSIFYVIMDGQLFNFIIWICEWFIVLYQR